MKLYSEINLASFEAWSGAVSTMDKLYNLHLCEELEALLEDMYPEGMSDTELNDLLWFEDESIAEWLGYEVCPHCGEWFESGEVCECQEEENEDKEE